MTDLVLGVALDLILIVGDAHDDLYDSGCYSRCKYHLSSQLFYLKLSESYQELR